MPAKFRRSDINPANKPGTVYLLHFSRPYKHCRHYIGFSEQPVDVRFAQHLNGHGSALTAAAREAGIEFTIARTWNADQSVEFILKSWASAKSLCPICSGEAAWKRASRYETSDPPVVEVEDDIPF
jgi:hypothetical protein